MSNSRSLQVNSRADTGADLEALVRDASMKAIREVADEYSPEEANQRAEQVVVERRHLEAARENVDI